MNLQANPPEMYRNFDTLIAVGENPIQQTSEINLEKDNLEENVDEI